MPGCCLCMNTIRVPEFKFQILHNDDDAISLASLHGCGCPTTPLNTDFVLHLVSGGVLWFLTMSGQDILTRRLSLPFSLMISIIFTPPLPFRGLHEQFEYLADIADASSVNSYSPQY